MRPTQILRAGGDTPLGKHHKFLGTWGNFGGMKQRGIISYAMSPNRQNPLAGTAHAAVFNSWRRFRHQVLYWAPPLVFFYYTLEWAIERNEYLNSKAGRKEYADAE